MKQRRGAAAVKKSSIDHHAAHVRRMPSSSAQRDSVTDWKEMERVSETRMVGDSSMTVSCPFCGEQGDIVVDQWVESSQSFIEDCEVCCHPRTIVVTRDMNGELLISCERA